MIKDSFSILSSRAILFYMETRTTALITFLRRLFYLRRTGRSFESPRYLLKWLLISTLIGLVAGIGAIAFYAAIHLATGVLLGKLVGYLPPDPTGEGSSMVMPLWSTAHTWLLPIITALGEWLLALLFSARKPGRIDSSSR
jgi:chloride channel protein, CIC family